MKAKLVFMVLAACVVIQGCSMKDNPSSGESSADSDIDFDYEKRLAEAQTTPYGKYPELITYTLAKMTGSNNSNLPEGDTYEDNAYTRCLREMLNIQNEDIYESTSEDYMTGISMMIATGNLADVMMVDEETLKFLVKEDLIEDLTDAYKNCASNRVKEIYNSYDDTLFDNATFDGKLMALPETNISDGPNLIWLRKDWMDKLGLSEPTDIADVEMIVKAFITEDPGNNGEGNTVGLVCDPKLSGERGYSSEYLMDIVFASYGAYPKQWIESEDGKIVYGSVQPEVKAALEHLNRLYEEEILDPAFLMRTTNNVVDLIVSGQCGSFFGPWWAPNNPLQDAIKQNPEADWRPYLIATDEDGSTSYHSQNPNGYYVVVRKGFKHPEIVFKMVSVMFDHIRYSEGEWKEFAQYYQLNVDPTARPLAINVDYDNALSLCYEQLNNVFTGKSEPESLPLLEYSYYEACKAYLDHGNDFTSDEWSAYASRIKASSLINKGNLNRIESKFFGETKSMQEKWGVLEELESAAYLKIVTGEETSEYFDLFVEKWYSLGGDLIEQEVYDAVNTKH